MKKSELKWFCLKYWKEIDRKKAIYFCQRKVHCQHLQRLRPDKNWILPLNKKNIKNPPTNCRGIH